MNIQSKLSPPQTVHHIYEQFKKYKPFKLANFNKCQLQIHIKDMTNDRHYEQTIKHMIKRKTGTLTN